MANHLNRIAVLFAIYSNVALALSATTPAASDFPALTTSYRRTIVQWEDDKSSDRYSWLVGADKKRRWIHDTPTLQCLRDIGIRVYKELSYEDLEKIPNLENAWATCGAKTMGPNEALEKRCYLQNGTYKFTLTTHGLVLSNKGKEVWSNGIEGDQLILETDGNLVQYNSKREIVWSSKTSGKKVGWLALRDDGIVHLFDANKTEIWKAQ